VSIGGATTTLCAGSCATGGGDIQVSCCFYPDCIPAGAERMAFVNKYFIYALVLIVKWTNF